MLKISCPRCQHPFIVKQPKAGQYLPTCRHCSAQFELTIEADTGSFRVGRWKPGSGGGQSGNPGKNVPPVQADITRQNPDPTRAPVKQPAKARSPADAEATRIGADESGNTSSPGVTGSSFVVSKTVRSSPNEKTEYTRAEEESTAGAGDAMLPASQLGGYRLIRELGRGGLGVVYLAKQISLNRNVALKLVQSRVASSPSAISRFIREAYAAAQLVHHNVVQVYDLGQEDGTNFFSMEFVQGKNLSELVRERGTIPPREAAGYILQAARGLRFVHHQGMVHRDIKPANLMLDHHGVVKVADLGLVKIPASADESVEGPAIASQSGSIELTGVGATVGTANYISPEQAAASTEVDHRADVYSLGCTLFTLVAGRPPFKGTSADEVIAQHRTQPAPRLEAVVPGVEKALGDVVSRMLEKRPEQRYSSLDETIRDLEKYLGISSGEGFRPTREWLQALEASQKDFYSQPLALARSWTPALFLGIGAIALIVLFFVSLPWAFAALSGLIAAPVTAFLLSGFRQQGVVFDRVRQLSLSGSWTRWLMVAGGVVMLVALLFALGVIGPWLLVVGLAAGLGAGYHLVIEQGLAKQREVALQPIQRLLREQRIAGCDEETLRQFVAANSSTNWEEFFEDLFGYDELQRARASLLANPQGPRRKTFRPLRDRIVAWLDRKLHAIRKTDDQRKLRQIEEAALVATGVSREVAAAQAEQMSRLLVDEADEWRKEASRFQSGARPSDPGAAAAAKRARFKAMMAEAKKGGGKRKSNPLETLERPLDLCFGAHVRFLAGALLIAGCALWLHKNQFFSGISAESIRTAGQAVAGGSTDIRDITSKTGLDMGKPRDDLGLPVVGAWVSNFNAGIAGLLLVASVILGGWRASLIVLPVAGAIWLGPVLFGLPWVWK
jgi:eukaryotic-like serine/threonine-protein kinase